MCVNMMDKNRGRRLPLLEDKREKKTGRQDETKQPVFLLRMAKKDLGSPNKTRH